MKQYTTPDQTAKLSELGLADSIREERYKRGVLPKNYSIGELIELIPDTGDRYFKNRQIFGSAVLFYGEGIIYDFDEEAELIDNLFNLVVRLKEDGAI